MPTENRYADANFWTVNGLYARKHITSMDSTGQYLAQITAGSKQTMYMACRFFKRSSDGTETELGTTGTYKAQASGTPTLDKRQFYGSYTYPDTALNPTDCLVVKVYLRLGDNSFTESDLVNTLVSEQLGAQSLDSNTLTVAYTICYDGAYNHKLWFGWYTLYGEYYENFGVYGWKWTPYTPPSALASKRMLVGIGL